LSRRDVLKLGKNHLGICEYGLAKTGTSRGLNQKVTLKGTAIGIKNVDTNRSSYASEIMFTRLDTMSLSSKCIGA
jgi:hypothetical protein